VEAMTNHQVADRLQLLTRKANQLRGRAKQFMSDEDDTLWMSSLDVIDELLDSMSGLMQDAGVSKLESPDAILLFCPHCQSPVNLPFEALAAAAAVCPICGDAILLTNPT
jgi:hypothetical protein